MKFVNLTTERDVSRDEVLSFLSDSRSVNDGVRFEEGMTPRMHLKEKGERIKITCEFTGGPSKDNGFLVGTYFSGKLTRREGGVTLRGVITTSPVYHAFLALLLLAFLAYCIVKRGFSIVPFCILAFDILLFWKEFKKQGFIARYLNRAFSRISSQR